MPHTPPRHSDRIADALVFVLLIAVGVVGRLNQPEWGFTPIAAVGLFAGAYYGRGYRSRIAALLVPALALAVSNYWLLTHDSVPVMLTVYAALMAPAMLGGWFAGGDRYRTRSWLGRLGVCSVAPATWFFLATNLAVWLFRSDYPKSLAGLVECYAAGIPFYRWMLLGDLLYVPLLLGLGSAAGALPLRHGGLQPATQTAASRS